MRFATMSRRAFARALGLGAVVVTTWIASVGCSGSHSTADTSKFNGHCGAKDACPGGYTCANFDIDDNDVDGLSCYAGTDPCAVVTCANQHTCVVAPGTPPLVICDMP
jgi:hypothetical protein